MEYLDFELRIAPGVGREYPVSVLGSPAGETSATMSFPFDTLALQNQLQGVEIAVLRSGGTRRDVVSQEQLGVSEFGRKLFEALMTGTVRENFRRSRDRACASGKGLRLRLRIEAPELAALPWEYLYDPTEADYVCLSIDTPIVRYLECDRPAEAITIQPPLSILGVIASPSDRPGLDVSREKQRVEAATAALREAGLIKLTWLAGSTWRDLQKAMRQGPYHIFHFVGHGGFDAASNEGVIALTDEQGKSALMSATQLGRLLADHDSLRMVVLNSCLGAKSSATDVFSSTASVLVRRGISAVVAMQYEISDLAAVEFARSLYEALADGMPVDAAVAEARKAISLSVNNTVEWGTPVLHMRSPDGMLFNISGMTTSRARESGIFHSMQAPSTTRAEVPRALEAAPKPAPSPAPARAAAPEPPTDLAPAKGLPEKTESRPARPRRRPVEPEPLPTEPEGGGGRRVRFAGVGVTVLAALVTGYFLLSPPVDTGTVKPETDTASRGEPPSNPPSLAPSWASTNAKVTGVSAASAGQDAGHLILAVDYNAPKTLGTAELDCVLRPGPEQRNASVTVPLAPDSKGGQYLAPFETGKTWAKGAYPVVCTADRTQIFKGNVEWPGSPTGPPKPLPPPSLKIHKVTASFLSDSLWMLGLAVDYGAQATQGVAMVDCSLRPSDPERREVHVAVLLSPGRKGGDYTQQLQVSRPWAEGRYPVQCSVQGRRIYEGRVSWVPPPPPPPALATWASTNAKLNDVKTAYVSPAVGNLIL
ncbi:MAG: hypothetical protein QOH59_1743, partial [Gemmatimonadales bacterium]|nr:hypothetical protein [Gemmatimonadales bacterium]